MEVFRTPEERFEDLPGYDFEPNYEQIDGLRLHYVDEGEGRPFVCFHGVPTWSYLYRKIAAPLLEAGHRVVLPDLAGAGRSDKPTDPDWYSFERHLELMTQLLGKLDLRDAVVVVQDWGGPIGLTWASQNASSVGALVILNTGLFTGRVSKGFMAWRDFAEKNPDLPVGFIIQGGTATEVPDDVLAAYEAPFPNAESKACMARFPLLVPTSEDDPMAIQQAALAEDLSRWEKPVLVAFSDGDPVFPFPKAGARFTDLISTAGEQVRIADGAHFLQEDRGERIAQEMIAFLEE